METRKTVSKKENKEYRRNNNRTETLLGGIICQENCSEVLLVGTTLVKTHIVKRMIQSTSMESINGNINDINCEDPVLEETPLAANVNNNANQTEVRRSPANPNSTSCHLEKGEGSVKKDPGGISSGSKELSKLNSEVKMSPCVDNTVDRKEMLNAICQEHLNTQQSKNRSIDEKKQRSFENVNKFLTNRISDTSFKRKNPSGMIEVDDPVEMFLPSNTGKSSHALTASCYGKDVSGKVQNLVKYFEALNKNKKRSYKEGSCTSVGNETLKLLVIDSNIGSSNEKTKSVTSTNDDCENSPENNQFTPHMTQLSIGLKNGELMYEILKDINNKKDSILESVPDKKDKRGSLKSYEPTTSNSSSDFILSMPTRGHQLPKLEVVVNRSTINGRNGSTSARMVNKAVSQSYSGYLSGVRDKPLKRRFTWRFLGCAFCALAFLFSTNFFKSV